MGACGHRPVTLRLVLKSELHDRLFKGPRAGLRRQSSGWSERVLSPGPHPPTPVCCRVTFLDLTFHPDVLGQGTSQREFCIYTAEWRKGYRWGHSGAKLKPKQNTPNRKGETHTLRYVNTRKTKTRPGFRSVQALQGIGVSRVKVKSTRSFCNEVHVSAREQAGGTRTHFTKEPWSRQLPAAPGPQTARVTMTGAMHCMGA